MTGSATKLLLDWRDGRAAAREQLWPLIYDELRRLAGRYMRDQKPGHTLQATALVHEAFVKLVDVQAVGESRGQFIALAARAMRSILVDHARGKGRAKRGGGAARVTLEDGLVTSGDATQRMLEIDDALLRLAAEHPRKADVAELHYFGGLTHEEMARVLKVSASTARADLRFARAWLRAELDG